MLGPVFQGEQGGQVRPGWPWSERRRQALPSLPEFLGSEHHEVPVVFPMACGNPAFSYAPEGVPYLCASSFLYPAILSG